jgi:signal transduction histidine kinase
VIKNGMEAMPNGGILEVNCLLTTPNHVAIRFQDYGVGIPEEQMHRLGEPFFTTKAEGTGLGLMVSHKIIEEHGGNMYISSEVGKGTVVEVLLPMRSREEETGA